MKQLRTIAAKASGVYVGIGQTHIAMRMAWAQHQDPLNFIFRQQVELWFRLFRCFPKDGQYLLKIAWQQTLERLQGAESKWQVVKGPLAALQASLLDVGRRPLQHDC